MALDTWLPAIPWLVPLAGFAGGFRRDPILNEAPQATGTFVSIIVPARNESATVDTLLPSLLASSYATFEIIVVDDRSTDDTAEKVRHWALRDPRLRLLSGEELPAGWLGKPWACAQGAAAAKGALLLFTDADTTHQPALLGRAVGALQRDKVDLLTLSGHLECVTFWERLVMPQIGLLLGVRFNPSRLNRAKHPWQVVANGQFILMPREKYFELGGHESVRGEVVEDLALAQHVVRSGQKLRMYHAEELFSTRMYRSLGEMIEGWSKNLYLGARLSMPAGILRSLAPLGVLAAFAFWLIPIGALAIPHLRPAAILAVGASLVSWALFLRIFQIPLRYALLYPLGALMSLAIVLRSVARGNRKVVWRGRSYRVKG